MIWTLHFHFFYNIIESPSFQGAIWNISLEGNNRPNGSRHPVALIGERVHMTAINAFAKSRFFFCFLRALLGGLLLPLTDASRPRPSSLPGTIQWEHRRDYLVCAKFPRYTRVDLSVCGGIAIIFQKIYEWCFRGKCNKIIQRTAKECYNWTGRTKGAGHQSYTLIQNR